MNRNKRGNAKKGGGPRAVRFAAALTEEDDLTLRRPNVGLGRVFFVVLMMHIVAIGGILAFKWLGKEEGLEPSRTPSGLAGESTPPTTPTVAPPSGDALPARSNGKAIIVDHPDPELKSKGYKRYRVALNETMPHIARQFNGGVAELEKINGFGSGEKLYAGQWITVIDHRGVKPDAAEPAPQPAPTPEPPAAEAQPVETIVATPIPLRTPAQPGPEAEPQSFSSVVEPRAPQARLTPIPQAAPQPENPAARSEAQQRLSAQPVPLRQPAPVEQPPLVGPRPFSIAETAPAPAQPQVAPRQPVIPQGSGPVSDIWRQGALDQLRPVPRPGAQPQAPPSYAGNPQPRSYRVVSGDTAYGISRRFGVEIQQLLTANGLSDPQQLRAGELIRIP